MDPHAEETCMKCISLKRTTLGALLKDAQRIIRTNSLADKLLAIPHQRAIRESANSSTSHAHIDCHNPPSSAKGSPLIEDISTWLDNQNILVRLERDTNALMDEYQLILDLDIYLLEGEERTSLLMQADIDINIILLVNAEETHRVNDSLEEQEEWIDLIKAKANKSLLRARGRELISIFISDAKFDKEEVLSEALETMTAIKFAEEGDREDLLRYLRNRDTDTPSQANTAHSSPVSQLSPQQLPYPQGIPTAAPIPCYNGRQYSHPADRGGMYHGPSSIYASSAAVTPLFMDWNNSDKNDQKR